MKKIKHCAGCLFKINYLSQNTCVSAIISVALIFGGIGFDSVFAAGNTNLMVCGDFENGFDGWTNIKNLNSDAAISSDYAYAGSGGLKLVGAMNEQYMYKLVDFDRTKSYELSAYVKSIDLSDGGFFMSLLGVNSNNTAVDWYNINDRPEHKALCQTGGTHDWKKVSLRFDGSVFDETTTKVQIYIFVPAGTSGEIWVDDVALSYADLYVYPEFERYGNVLLYDESINFPFKIKNAGVARELNIKYSIYDDRNQYITSGENNVFTHFGNTVYNLILPVYECGAYDVQYEISATDGSYKDSGTERFVIIMQDNSDNLNYDLGLCSHCTRFYYHHASPDNYFDAFARIGAGWVREEIRWEYVEKSKGVYCVTDKIEKTFNAIKENNQKALVLLGYGNTLYDMETIAVVPTTEAQLNGWKNYVRFVVGYIKDKGFSINDVVFEVWNEYSGGMSNSTSVPNEHYVNIVRLVKEAVDEIMPGVRVMQEGMAHVTDRGGHDRFETYCQTGVFDYANVVGMHPYTRPHQPDENNLFTGAVSDFRNVLSEYNIENMPIFHSEVGWPVYNGDAYGAFSERESAISVVRLCTLNKQMQKEYGQNDVLFVHKGADQTYSIPTENYGLMSFPWAKTGASAAKLPYVTFAAASSIFGDAEFECSREGENIKIFKFKKTDGRELLVMWAEKESKEIRLSCSGIPVFYDMKGNVIELDTSAGEVNLSVGREPVFALGDSGIFTDIEPRTPKIGISYYSNICINGTKAYITLSGTSELDGKTLSIEPKLPPGWKWLNSEQTFYGNEDSVLEFYVPKSNVDAMNSIVLSVNVGVISMRLERQIESVVSIYGDNLINDPSFEGKLQTKAGNEWRISDSLCVSADKEIFHSGKQSVRITKPANTGNNVFIESPLPKITPNKSDKYLMSGWIKASGNTTGSVDLVMHSTESWTQEIIIKPGEDWARFSTVVSFDTGHAGNEFSYYFNVPADFGGDVWIDDVELRRIRLPNDYKNKELIAAGVEIDGNIIPDSCAESSNWTFVGNGTMDSTESQVGEKSIKTTSGYAVAPLPFMKVDYNQKYVLSAYVKAEQNMAGTAELILTANDRTKKTEMVFTPRKEWIKYSTVVDFSDRTDKESFRLNLLRSDNFSGAVWFDNISLVPIDQSERNSVKIELVDNLDNGYKIIGKMYLSSDSPIMLMAAVYSENGMVKGCVCNDKYNAVFGLNIFEIDLPGNISEQDTVRLFVWDNKYGIKPIKHPDMQTITLRNN